MHTLIRSNTWNKMFLLMFFLTFIVLPGCSKQPAATDAATDDDVTLNVSECARALQDTIAFQDGLSAISDQMIAAIYRIPPGAAVQQQVYVSSGATAEEIAVFEAADAEAAQKIEIAVRQRIDEQKASFADYLPAELPKLEDPFILVKGKYVVLCISDHNAAAKTALDPLFK